MNIILSAIICGLIAGLGSALAWLAYKHLGLSDKGQRIGQVLALIVGIAVIRIAPIDQLALRFQSTGSVEAQADAELAEVPAFKVLRDYYPAEYAAMRDTAVDSLKAGEPKLQTINRIRPRLLEIFNAQMVKASDATISRQLNFIVKQATFLQGQNPQFCHELLNTPGTVTFDPTQVFPREMADEELNLMADILRETATLPAVTPQPLDEAQFQPVAERAFSRLTPSDVATLTSIDFDLAQATTVAHKTAGCHFALGIMEEVNALPLAEKARTFRSLVAVGQNPP